MFTRQQTVCIHINDVALEIVSNNFPLGVNPIQVCFDKFRKKSFV